MIIIVFFCLFVKVCFWLIIRYISFGTGGREEKMVPIEPVLFFTGLVLAALGFGLIFWAYVKNHESQVWHGRDRLRVMVLRRKSWTYGLSGLTSCLGAIGLFWVVFSVDLKNLHLFLWVGRSGPIFLFLNGVKLEYGLRRPERREIYAAD